ncbi:MULTISPECIES: NAD-dependent epimerase/dehydratase family protein [unclassified Mycobacterium]|uniref:NAD-dependent epimerase/dehydratase family protein n=1 Tax=unclassified Mycobacterium TaxID=2642494 RepID=UPI0029C68EA5|nr:MULTISPECIES: NAD-dependent epimerase/dehydratase family protein [unclassified Mycobacterium]
MRIAVTGASGVFGRGIAARLRSEGHDIVGLARHRPERWPADCDFVQADIRDAEGVRRAVEGAEVVAHCAWVVNATPDEALTREINVGGAENVLAEMKRTGSRRIVFASSVLAYGPQAAGTLALTEDAPLNPLPAHWYGFHKSQVEAMLAESGNEWVAIRPGIVVGRNVDNVVLKLLASPVFPDVEGSADRPVQVVHTDDVHRIFVQAVLGSNTGAVNLAASGQPTFREITAAIGRRIVPVNRRLLKAGLGMAFRRGLVESSPSEFDLLLNFPIMNTDRLVNEWGYRPAFDAHECLDDFALAVRGRMALGKTVFNLPWRTALVNNIPPVDEPATDGVTPAPAGPEGMNGEFDTPIDPRYPTFVASNLSEALPGPFSPASASSTVRGLRAGGVSIAERLRLRGTAAREVGTRSVGVFAHRLHAGVTSVYYMGDAMPGTNPDSLTEQFFGRVLGDTPIFGAQRPPVDRPGLFANIADVIGVCAAGVGLLMGSSKDSAAYVADVNRLERLVPADLSLLDAPRLESLTMLARDLVVHGWVLASWSAMYCTATATVAQRKTGTQDAASAHGIASGRALEGLRRLVALAGEDPEAIQALAAGEEQVVDSLRLHTPALYEAFVKELADIGHRGPGECELRSQTYADNPALFARMVAKSLTGLTPSSASPPLLETSSTPARVPAAARLAAWQLREREIRRDKVVRATWLLRLLLRETGRRLVDNGVLNTVDDVFYLLVDELEALPPDVSELVSRRRAEQRKFAGVRLPASFSGRWTPAEDSPALRPGDVLHGLGVSGGRVQGRVRIVDADSIDDLQPGEVLVAEVTDVGYTPAFEYAAAVVTNLGGQMSHAAIVAREFGVTCVVDARNATRCLADGALVEVDGATGEIRILEQPSADVEAPGPTASMQTATPMSPGNRASSSKRHTRGTQQ